MANFNQLDMAQALLSHPSLTVKSGLFGLVKKLVYTPTGSPLRVIKNNYNPESLPQLQRIIEAGSAKEVVAAVRACNVNKLEIGNIELDACVSADRQFVALQLLQFGDYAYRPISQPAFFEGELAQQVSLIL